MKRIYSLGLGCFSLLLGACGEDRDKDDLELSQPVRTNTAPELPKPTAAHQRVMNKLNSGMLRIPAVAMESHKMMSEIGKNGVTIVDQAIKFDKWLDEYAKTHKKEMAKAQKEQELYGGIPDVRNGIIMGPGGNGAAQSPPGAGVQRDGAGTPGAQSIMLKPEKKPAKIGEFR